MTAPTTPAQVRPELLHEHADGLRHNALIFRDLNQRSRERQLYNAALALNEAGDAIRTLSAQCAAQARELEEHDALQSQLSNEQLVAQHYKESCDILRERAEAAQQAVAEREARLALAVEALESLLHEDGGSLAHSANHPKCAAARAVIAACKEA